MRKTSWPLACAVVIAMAASAGAQTKFSGKCEQGKPDPTYTVAVGDRPDHSISLGKVTCVWAPGAELAGVALKDEQDTFTSDASGKVARDKGYGVGALANGDKYYVSFQGTTTMENNAPVSATCTWNFTGGTGKVEGLTGKGTCTGKFDATGAAVFDIHGEYSVPPAKAK